MTHNGPISTDGIPPAAKEIYRRLWNETVYLHGKWNTYLKLFTEEETIEILNKHGRGLFGLVQDVLIRDLLLGLSRLTDPATTGKYTNLSLAALAEAIDPAADPTFYSTLAKAVAKAKTSTAFAKIWRDKLLAHFDLQTALGTPAIPLPDYERSEIVHGVQCIEDVLNLVSQRYQNGASTAFYMYEASDNGVSELIWNLKRVPDPFAE